MDRYSLRQLDDVAPGHYNLWLRRGIVIAMAAYALVATVDVVLLGQVRYTSVSQATVLLLGGVALALASRRKTSAGAAVIIGAIWMDVFVGVAVEATVVGSWVMVPAVLVVGAGILLGPRAARRLAILTSGSLLPVASIRGVLGTAPFPGSQDVLWTVIMMVTLGAVVAITRQSLNTFGTVLESALERGRAESQVAHMGRIIEGALNEIYVFNSDTLALRLVNRGARENLGYEGTELKGLTMADLNPTFRDVGGAALRRLTAGDEDMPRVRGVHQRKDKSVYPVEMILQAGTIEGEEVVIAFAEDLTDRERAEAEQRSLEVQLQHAQKMEAVGFLAGGVAHDFNNLLTVVGGYAEILADASDPDISEIAGEIARAQARGTTLTRKLLAFARKEVRDPRPVSLAAIVRDLEVMLSRLLAEHHHLRLEAAGPGWIVADVSQMEQIVLNLVANARDAMPDGGTVTIQVEDPSPATPPDGQPMVRFSVCDQGMGMSLDTQERVFEPFFTTKPRGKGTGLGLSTVHGIVSQNGGRIELESTVGAGTSVHVFLPLLVEVPEHVESPVAPAAAPTGGARSILLAEDEEAARGLFVRILERAGYQVRAVGDAAAALAVLDATPESVDLLLTDVVMPGTSGIELANVVHERWPELPVLFMSGYLDDRLGPGDALDPSKDLLLKPFSGEDLCRRVASAMVRTAHRD